MFFDSLNPPVLKCDLCGAVLKILTLQEVQMMADKPYNYVVFCETHSADEIRSEW